MVAQLIGPNLLQVVLAQYHVLDQLSDFLIEFDHVRPLMNKVLYILPFLEFGVEAVVLLGSATERVNQSTKQLRRHKGLHLRLLDPQYVRVRVETNLLERLHHLVLDFLVSDGWRGKRLLRFARLSFTHRHVSDRVSIYSQSWMLQLVEHLLTTCNRCRALHIGNGRGSHHGRRALDLCSSGVVTTRL